MGDTILENVGVGENSVPGESSQTLEPATVVSDGFFSVLLKKSPDKAIEEYNNHPLNYDRKESTGRILRGLEGLFSDLNYAIVDILLGILEKWKEGRQQKPSVKNMNYDNV